MQVFNPNKSGGVPLIKDGNEMQTLKGRSSSCEGKLTYQKKWKKTFTVASKSHTRLWEKSNKKQEEQVAINKIKKKNRAQAINEK